MRKNLQWSWEERLRHSLTINLTSAHSLRLAPVCQDLPGLLAHTLTPPCSRLPGSPRIACTLGLAQQSQKLLLTRHLLVAWLWWPLGLARKCPTGMLQSINPWLVAPAQGQQLERSKTVIIYRWHDTKKKTLKTLPKSTRINKFSKATG